MKKKITIILMVCCLLISSILPFKVINAEASKSKQSDNLTTEYAKWGITIVNKIYYHDGTRIRIFQDMKSDKSLKKSFVDAKGTVDIRLLRNKKGIIIKRQYINKEEAKEILEDMLDNSSDSDITKEEKVSTDKANEIINIKRYLISEVPSNIQKAVNKCSGKDFYLIKGNGKQYIYYNHLSGDYAYQSKDSNLDINDIGSKKGIYVLISIPDDVKFTLSYNSISVTYKKIIA